MLKNKYHKASNSYYDGIIISQNTKNKITLHTLKQNFAISEAHISFENIHVGDVYQLAWGPRAENQLFGSWSPPEIILKKYPLQESEIGTVKEGRRNLIIEKARNLTKTKVRNPIKIKKLQGHGIIHISCGEKVSGAISCIGKLFLWGYGDTGCLGLMSRNDVKKPTVVENFFKKSPISDETLEKVFKNIDNDDDSENLIETTYFLNNSESNVSNVDKIISSTILDENSQSSVPKSTIITFNKDLEISVRIKQVTFGYEHSIALSDDGFIFSCGRNTYGQLGRGKISSCSNPFMVMVRNKK